MEEDKVVSLKYYDSVIDAELDMEILKENAIQCIYNDDTMVGLFPIFDDKERGIELMVFENDYEKAKQILDDYHQSTDNTLKPDDYKNV